MRDASPYRVEIVEGLSVHSATGRRRLGSTDVIVAFARPDEVAEPGRQSALRALLSDDEEKRLTRFRFQRDRDLFLVAHALLRITLSRYANIAPYVWQFRNGSHGRPEIAEPGSRLRFSLSHTHGLAACAIVLDHDVGLDVEYISRDPPVDLAHGFFSPRERSDILGAAIDTRARVFLEYWTLKEAYAKARGLGLSLPLDQFSLYKDTDGRWRIVPEPPLHEDQERWRFWSWHAGSVHQVALAIDQSEAAL
jgi:4'-phosphopantetheinyl transferase